MKLNSSKSRVITFTKKTIVLHYTYELWGSSIALTDTMKCLGVQLNSKFHFQVLADYIISQSVRIKGLIHAITYSSPTLDSLLIFYLTLVRPKFEYTSTVWTSITSTYAKMLETIQQKFISLCQYRLFICDHVI
jgi:hypothetical protein